jgi:folate-binding protein YgfZ
MNNWHPTPETSAAPLSEAQLADGFVAPIKALGIISVSGDDAASFLHNQLTNDVEHLSQSEVRLAGYCTPKGRLQATFTMWRNAESIFLMLPADIQPPLQKRLTMFVLRAKAKLADASDVVMLGMGGAKATSALARFADIPAAANQKTEGDFGTVLRLADAFGAPRFLWLTDAATADAQWPPLAEALHTGSEQAWELAAIHAGVPQIAAATQDQFVPQMVNYELLGGVNFKKGCYPGQEIVARSQYLGKLKRRTTLATIPADAAAGNEVFSESDPGQPCGMIVNAAPNGAGGSDVLVEVKLGALDEVVHLGAPDGPLLQFRSMPYILDALEV